MISSICANKVWPYLFALQILLVLMPFCVKANDDIMDFNDLEEYEGNQAKRSWQKLHGAWGKRALADADVFQYGLWRNIPTYAVSENDDNIYDDNMHNEKRDWKKLSAAWGKRRLTRNMRIPNAPPKRQETQNWNNLKGMWGKRSLPVEDYMGY